MSWAAARVLVAAALLAWVFHRTTPGEAAAALGGAPWWIWLVVPGLFLANSAVYTGRVVVLLPGRTSFAACLRAVLVANFAGLALPTGGGEAAKVVTLAPHVGGPDRALAAIVVARLVELAVWGALVVWAAVGVLPGKVDVLVPAAWAVGLGFVAVAALGLGVLPVPAGLIERMPGRAGAFLGRSGAAFDELRSRRGRLVASFALALVFAALNVLAAAIVLRVYGLGLSHVEVLGLVPAMDVAISAPVSVSGVGVRESVFVWVLRAWGADPAASVAMAYTRWAGHLARAAVGAVLFAVSRSGGGAGSPGR